MNSLRFDSSLTSKIRPLFKLPFGGHGIHGFVQNYGLCKQQICRYSLTVVVFASVARRKTSLSIFSHINLAKMQLYSEPLTPPPPRLPP